MGRIIKFNGFCSHINKHINKHINYCIKYAQFNQAGSLGTAFTKMELECPYIMKCGIDSAMDCPFFCKAPENINLP